LQHSKQGYYSMQHQVHSCTRYLANYPAATPTHLTCCAAEQLPCMAVTGTLQ
jgi:hypothetical protein